MRVLLILDEVFATRERPLIERLEIGLADEGVRLVRALPDTLDDPPSGGLFVEVAGYASRGLALSRRARARRLLERVSPGVDRPIDVVHALGGAAWAFAAEVATLAGVPLLVEAWRAGLAARIKSIRAALPEAIALRALCPDEHALSELASEGLSGLARATPWGVLAADEDRAILPPDIAPALVLVGSGRDSRAMTIALEGLVDAIPPSSEARLFIDSDAARKARLWSAISRLGLSERTSLVPGLEAHRELTLLGDVLLVPESLGEHRTILLDAMGSAMAVIAAADPRISWLIDGVTACIVGGSGTPPGPPEWAEAIRRTVLAPDLGRALGCSARGHVRENCRATAHISAVMAVYDEVTAARAGAAT